MTTVALGAAAASATAAAISATFAGGTSVAAWLTIRGRRPKLTVRTAVGNPDGGALVPDPTGVAFSVRVANVRDLDIEVIELMFEPPRPRFARLRRRPVAPALTFPTDWLVEGAGEIPGSVKAHHTELYAFRTSEIGVALHLAGHGTYRPVVECAGDRKFRGDWFTVDGPADPAGPSHEESVRSREI